MGKFPYQSPIQDENWNVAGGYASSLVLSPLVNCYNYNKIAKFGTSNIEEVGLMDNTKRSLNRVDGLKFYISELMSLLDQCIFACRSEKNFLYEYYTILERIEEKMNEVLLTNFDEEGDETFISINEMKFNNVTKVLNRIRRDVTKILNSNHMIFPTDSGIDPDEYVKKFIEDYANSGN